MKNKIFIIAEAGCNHNGHLKKAFKLIKIAKYSGADAIKFQMFDSNLLVTKFAEKANYAKKNTNKKQTQLEMQRKLELSFSDHRKLKKKCDYYKIKYLTSVFDIKSLKYLKKLNVKTVKIPSGEINNVLLLRYISTSKFKIILSSGMSTKNEISNAIRILTKGGIKKRNITLLQCNSEYPTPFEDVNLNVMKNFEKKFKVKVGISDHTLGIEVPVAAAAMGAKVIEKHFTINRNLRGPDHKASLTPHQLRQMVKSVRNIEKALGKKNKVVTNSEKKNVKIARKSLVASKKIAKGEKFTSENLCVKRPGTGISADRYFKVLGKISKKNFLKDQLIKI